LLMMILAFASDIYQFYMLSDIYFCTIIEQMPVPPIETVGGIQKNLFEKDNPVAVYCRNSRER